MRPLTIDTTTLCPCLHIRFRHGDETGYDGPCLVEGCHCQRFTPGARTSSHHYQRGQKTTQKRVARLEPGDRVLVGFPGTLEHDRNERGGWENPHIVQDHQLRPARQKTGALVATVTGRHTELPRRQGWRRSSPTLHVIETDLGELPALAGVNAVTVLA